MTKRHEIRAQFVACVTDYKDDFYRLAYSYVKNQQDALDIVQDAIQKGLQALERLEKMDSMKSWFYKIVVRTAIDFLRKHKRVTVTDDETLDYLQSGAEDHYEDIDLHEALERLPIEYRSIIVLRYFEDLKIDEIAEIMAENVNTVKTRLYRGLKLLRIEITEGTIHE